MIDLELFKSILSVQSVSYNQALMIDKIKSELSTLKNVSFYENKGNIYATKQTFKANIVPCIVSHMDTVHKITSDLYCLQVGENITGFNRLTMSQTGIGGDDKVGIFICLQCLEYLDNCKVVFFSNEETGCEGSYEAKMNFFKNCSFVLQCDRKGNNDFVDNASGVELSNIDFQNAIFATLQSYGYNFSNGGMTDVMALKENGLKICCANMSCGYYNPHQSNEYVNITDVENCKNMVLDLCNRFGNIKFTHIRKKKTYQYTDYDFDKYYNLKYNDKKFSKSNFDSYLDEKKTDIKFCDNCSHEVEYVHDEDDYFCPNCMMYGSEIKEFICAY